MQGRVQRRTAKGEMQGSVQRRTARGRTAKGEVQGGLWSGQGTQSNQTLSGGPHSGPGADLSCLRQVTAPGPRKAGCKRKVSFVGGASGNLQVFRDLGCRKVRFFKKVVNEMFHFPPKIDRKSRKIQKSKVNCTKKVTKTSQGDPKGSPCAKVPI